MKEPATKEVFFGAQSPKANLKLVFNESENFSENEIRTLLEGCLTENDSAKLILNISAEKIQLLPSDTSLCGPVFVDFSSKKLHWRKRQGELIHRATGLSKHKHLHITDATAGLGVDAFILACADTRITLIEQNPVVFLLLYDGLERARQAIETAKQVSQIQLVHSNSESYLARQNKVSREQADVIYLDPMYPQTAKSAKSNKRMQLLQLLETSPGKSTILDTAIQYARHRVVVKRPANGKYLEGRKPSFSLKGRSTRFDIYTNRAFNKE